MEAATSKLAAILQHADKLGLNNSSLCELPSMRLVMQSRKKPSERSSASMHFVAGFVSVTLALVYILGLNTSSSFTRIWFKWNNIDIHEEMCTIPMPEVLTKAFRPPEDCSICKEVTSVDKVQDISPEEFEAIFMMTPLPNSVMSDELRYQRALKRTRCCVERMFGLWKNRFRYAYTGKPVVVQGAMVNWTAQHVFHFTFFKELYEHSERQEACQFFPYKTEFTGLREVFNMSRKRAEMQADTDPWYIGWSNCDKEAARILRQHYSRPYFLPGTSENKKVDWIFMGSPGYGAKMHVDNVGHPSWQAQLKGSKMWILQPPPECIYHCNTLHVTVQPEEIIVLDTNRWYHETRIVSQDISITIGAEYD